MGPQQGPLFWPEPGVNGSVRRHRRLRFEVTEVGAWARVISGRSEARSGGGPMANAGREKRRSGCLPGRPRRARRHRLAEPPILGGLRSLRRRLSGRALGFRQRLRVSRLRGRARPPRPGAMLADVPIDSGAALRLPANRRTPPRFTRDGVHSVGAAYLCEKSTACERPGRRLEPKATPAPSRLVIV
jgi:hypothetical protein